MLAEQVCHRRQSPCWSWWRRLVRIRVIELMDHVLSTYDREISNYTAGLFSRCAIPLLLYPTATWIKPLLSQAWSSS